MDYRRVILSGLFSFVVHQSVPALVIELPGLELCSNSKHDKAILARMTICHGMKSAILN